MRPIQLASLLILAAGTRHAPGQDCEHRWTHIDVGAAGASALLTGLWAGEPTLFAAGGFESIDGVPAAHIAAWNGVAWKDLEGVLTLEDGKGGPLCLALYDGHLYVGGVFTLTRDERVNNIARWDGQSWSDVSGGLTGQPPVWAPKVNCLYVWDDGLGPALYAGGWFDTAGEVPASGVARWDGQSWAAVGGGVGGIVASMAVWDDGTGEALYCGGFFGWAGDKTVSGLAKWDGQEWHDVGGGVSSPEGPGPASALMPWDDGSGEKLYVAGAFHKAGGQTIRYMARWDGQAWDAMGNAFASKESVASLCIFDNGAGPALYAGGDFDFGFDKYKKYRVSNVRWDGASHRWVGQGKGPYGGVRTMASFPVNSEPTLWVGGSFQQLGDQKNKRGLAYHQGGSTEHPADTTRDGVLDYNDYNYFKNKPFDYNGDGVLDLFDYLDFINAFNAGCP